MRRWPNGSSTARWLIAEFGDRPIGKSYIRSADKQIAAIRAYGDPFANVR